MMAVFEKYAAGRYGHLLLTGHSARLQPLLPYPLSCPVLLHLLLTALLHLLLAAPAAAPTADASPAPFLSVLPCRLDDLTPAELESLADWERTFNSKYEVVGKVGAELCMLTWRSAGIACPGHQ
jgi:hypothetical protein